jgi:aspartyl-tRNA(Asn)/glutamyl-tRNA(Gln) amidotransferase subunit A
MNLSSETIASLRRLLLAGDISSEDITRALLEQIQRADPLLHAYASIDQEQAMAAARCAHLSRPLGGIPILIKDNINVMGDPCSCGSRILEGYVAPYDATVIRKLRDAGAIPLGRSNMDEFAMGSSTEHSAFHTTSNPWDLDRVPGGSSGGAAAAVAANAAIAALGSDTGGSIRQPAAFCGCVGIKPTYGRVSRYGLVAFASSLDQIGPVVKTVEDGALLLQAIAGHDPLDNTSCPVPVPDYASALDGNIKGLRVGIPKEYFVDGIDPGVASATRAAIDWFAAHGASVKEVSLPHTEYATAVYYIVATAEASANLARFDGIRYGKRCQAPEDLMDLYRRTRAEGFGQEVKRRIILGTYALSSGYYDAYYNRAQKVRRLMRQDFERTFEHCDIILTPATPTTAFRKGEKMADPLQMYLADVFTNPANLAGVCGISIPCGFSPNGLPIGLQIMGPHFQETSMLRAAYAYEQAHDLFRRKPALAAPNAPPMAKTFGETPAAVVRSGPDTATQAPPKESPLPKHPGAAREADVRQTPPEPAPKKPKVKKNARTTKTTTDKKKVLSSPAKRAHRAAKKPAAKRARATTPKKPVHEISSRVKLPGKFTKSATPLGKAGSLKRPPRLRK